jgi:hypothetical protein
MNDNRGKKIMIACLCILFSAIFLTTSFLHKRKLSEEGKDQKEQKTVEEQYEPELYQESGEPIIIYFTNTAEIDEKGALPFKELEQLTEKTQEFLKSKGNKTLELKVINGSLRKEENVTYFSCEVGEAVLEIGFNEGSDQFHFVFKEGGE